jgi:hypothetical protein
MQREKHVLQRMAGLPANHFEMEKPLPESEPSRELDRGGKEEDLCAKDVRCLSPILSDSHFENLPKLLGLD